MAKSRTPIEPVDIADEKYAGPSAPIAALGEGAVDTKFAWLIGLLIGGGLAYFNHRSMNKFFIEPLQKGAVAWESKTEKGFLPAIQRNIGGLGTILIGKGKAVKPLLSIEEAKQAEAVLGDCVTPDIAEEIGKTLLDQQHARAGGFAHGLANELAKLIDWTARGFRKQKLPDDFRIKNFIRGNATKEVADSRLDAVIVGGGTSALAAMGIASVYGGKKGIDRVSFARDQLNRAQDEILTTRAQYQALREKYVEVKTELDELKTARTVQETAATASESALLAKADGTPGKGAGQQLATQQWTPEGGVEDPKFPQEPKVWGKPPGGSTSQAWTPDGKVEKPTMPWGDKVGGAKAAKADSWKENLAQRDETAAHAEPARS